MEEEGLAGDVIEEVVIDVVCPDGYGAGDEVEVDSPAGNTLLIVVPEGIAAGDTFQVTLPPEQEQAVVEDTLQQQQKEEDTLYLEALIESKLWDSTLFIWTTDNGSPCQVKSNMYKVKRLKCNGSPCQV